MKIVIIISLFVSLICTSQGSSTQLNIEEMNERNFEEKLSDETLQELGKALKNETFKDEYKQKLKLLGEAIFAGKIVDDKDPEQLKLLGKAILDEKLTTELKNLLGDFLLSKTDKTESEKKFRQLVEILAKNETVADTRPVQSQIQGDEPAPPSHNEIGQNGHELTSVDEEDDVALKRLSEVLKSDNFLNENIQKITNLLGAALGSEKLLYDEHKETFRLLGKALSFGKFVDNNYPKTLKLLGDAIVSNQISKNRNNETLQFLSNVYINKEPSDQEAFRQLAEMLLKKERSENNVSKPQASTIDIIQETPLPLSDEAVNGSNENQVSHDETPINETTPNDGLPNEQDFTTVDQNAENASMEITESAEPKKRGKRNSKSNVKSNSDSLESKDKAKESRKSSKKTKRSRRSTKDITKPKSKNKHKRSKRKKSKERTEISGHDDVPNSKDTDMMGDDPNTYNENVNSEAPFTKTVDTKPAVVDSKTNDKSSTSYKNDNSKLFNSYYPEEYKRFVPLNPAIAYRRPKMLFLNDDNQIIPKLKTVVGKQSQGKIFEDDDMKPQTPVNFPKNRLVLTFTVSRGVY
jgi:hypothetical protein